MNMAKCKRRTMACVMVLMSCSLVAGTWFVARAGSPKRLSPEPRLIAHEWGTMTEVMGEEGEAITWQPLLPPSDLPGFVYGMGGSIGGGFKRFCAGTVRMETPVVYLYSDVETEASVKVTFPRGNITEWYPDSTLISGGVDWQNLRVIPEASADLPFDDKKKESRYYAARSTDSNLLRVATRRG